MSAAPVGAPLLWGSDDGSQLVTVFGGTLADFDVTDDNISALVGLARANDATIDAAAKR